MNPTKLFYMGWSIGQFRGKSAPADIYEALEMANVDKDTVEPSQVVMVEDANPYCTRNNNVCETCPLKRGGRDCEGNWL